MKISILFRHVSAGLFACLWVLFPGVGEAHSDEGPGPRAHYRLTFDEDTPRLVTVEAQITVSQQTIRMYIYGQPYLDDGWATWVEGLTATTLDGTPVEARLVDEGWGSWSVAVEDGTVLNLSYTVRLTHDEYDWDSVGGQDARPSWVNGAFYGVTRAFFIYSNTDGASTVRIDKPESWEMASPWEAHQGDDTLFSVPNHDSLVSNVLVLGDFERLTAHNDQMQIIIALDNELSAYGSEFINVIHTMLNEYTRIFDNAPPIYIVAIRSADEHDGEAFYNSFNQVIMEQALGGSRVVWAGVLSHEMFHLYAGGSYLQGTDKTTVEWFSEGFTEYYTSLSMLRTGLIDEDTYYEKLGYYLSRYYMTTQRWPEERISLVDAGQDKGANWFFLYGGGAVMALALDLDIREQTDGERSLDDVMGLLMRRFGDTGRTHNVQDVLDAVNEISGSDYTDFFNDYIRGNEAYLDIEPYLATVGIRVDSFSDEFYLSEDGHQRTTWAERRRFEQWTGRDPAD